MDQVESKESSCVLFVDDDASVLQSIKRSLMDESYEMLFALGGKEALEIIEKNDVHVIVSDMKMPVMTGLELLRIVAEKHPNIIRMVLSGYNQLPQVFATINNIRVFKYIPKPWDTEQDLIPAIREAVEQYKMTQTFKQFNSALERKNAFYQKLLKGNDDKYGKLKADYTALRNYCLESLDAFTTQAHAFDGQSSHEGLEGQISLIKRIIKQSIDLQLWEPGYTTSDVWMRELNQVKAIWGEWIHSKYSNLEPKVNLNFSQWEALKPDIPIPHKQLLGIYKMILFELYSYRVVPEGHYDFTVEATLDEELKEAKLVLILHQPLCEESMWVEELINQSIRLIVSSEQIKIENHKQFDGLYYTLLFTI